VFDVSFLFSHESYNIEGFNSIAYHSTMIMTREIMLKYCVNSM
jgi:hypothetical protein